MNKIKMTFQIDFFMHELLKIHVYKLTIKIEKKELKYNLFVSH